MTPTTANSSSHTSQPRNSEPLNEDVSSGAAGFALDSIEPLDKRDLLVAQVEQRLRDGILSGEMAPNTELPPEGRLAEAFNVSRTVIREAMHHLRAHDLVEMSRGRPATVKPVDPQLAIATLDAYVRRSGATLYQLVEVRRALECEVAMLAAARATDEQIEHMVEANEAMRSAETTSSRIHHDWLFHEYFAEASNNAIFVLLMKTVAGLFKLSLAQTSHSDLEVAYANHRRLIGALRRRDPQLARSIVLDNLQATEHDLEESPPDSPPAPPASQSL